MSTNGGKTGWPPGLLQDDEKKLSRWLSNRPGARRAVDQRCAEIRAQERSMSITTQSKCYSLDNEEFNHDSLGDLLDSMIEPAVGDVYYEADCRPFTNADVVSRHEVNSIIESLDEQAYEEIGEVFDNEFSNVTQEAKAELFALLATWADKHVSLERYWKITGKSREMKLTAEDLE